MDIIDFHPYVAGFFFKNKKQSVVVDIIMPHIVCWMHSLKLT